MRRLLLAVLLLVAVGLPATRAKAATPVWPTLTEQLSRDGIAPESALARLIAANQDFQLLRPEEARDHIRVPLWLRVLWRKAHPAQRYPANDPTGGYPFVLKEVHEWMVTHPDLLPGAAPAPVAPAPIERTAKIGTEVSVSGPPAAPRSESDIRIDFRNPSRIISASNDIEVGGRQIVYYSGNGGATWGQTSLPLVAGDAFHSDPTVDWTSDGTAWSTTIGITASGGTLRMRAYKSTDGGATWTSDATFSGSQTSTDKQMIWVDHSDSSPWKDNLYAIWHDVVVVYVNRRTGPTGAWQTPLRVSGAETLGTGIGADVKTNANGDVFAFWPDTGDDAIPGSPKIYFVKSVNGGVSWSAPALLAPTFGSFDIGVPAFNNRQALIYVSAGAYRTASKDLVYALWGDLSGAAGCTTPTSEPGSTVASTCKTRIWFARSTNGGANWSAPVMLNNQASLNDQFNPWLAVDETNGTVAAIYYDTVADPGRTKTNVYYQSSFDDGVTWGPPIKVTAAPTDETADSAELGNQYGDYNALSGYATKFFPSWTDRRDDSLEEIWTAAIQDVPCTFTGTPAIGAATTPAGNQIQVPWTNGAPASARFTIYRAPGTCAAPGAFQPIASDVTGTSYLDTTVSGTLSYAYRVAGLDVTGFCESAPSTCTDVVATGVCTAAPSFAGLQSVTNAGTAGCGLSLAWAAGSPTCSGPLTYNVYRSTVPGFVPGPATRLATGVSGTSFTDTSLLNSAQTYSYAIRAVDATNGAEEGNTVQLSGSPTGPAALGTLAEGFENGLSNGFDTPGWSHAALSGRNDWSWTAARSQTPTHSWFSASQASPGDRVLVSPPFLVQGTTTLSFWHTFAFEGSPATCYDGGTLEITTNGGANWSPLPDGIFTGGGFNGTITSGFRNPLAGKRGWCGGTLGAMTPVTVNLGSFAGNQARLRWHAGDDSINAGAGWYVDSVTLSNASVAGTCTPGASSTYAFYTVTPCRLVDTRNPTGSLGGPALAPLAQRSFSLSGACGLPATARAISVNVTVVGPATAGDLRFFPADQPTPLASILNFSPGQTRTNNANLGLAWGLGTLTVQNDSTGAVQLILDVNGYYQ